MVPRFPPELLPNISNNLSKSEDAETLGNAALVSSEFRWAFQARLFAHVGEIAGRNCAILEVDGVSTHEQHYKVIYMRKKAREHRGDAAENDRASRMIESTLLSPQASMYYAYRF